MAETPNGTCVILSTVHGAKGQEYDRVYIDPDVAASLSRPGGPLASEFGDEANIAYVAFTRAIRELYLPQDFKNILTPPNGRRPSSGMNQFRAPKQPTPLGPDARGEHSLVFQALDPAN